MIVFEDKVFKEIIYVKMRLLGWVLIQYAWCPYRKRRLGHRHTQREDQARTQGEDGCLRAEERYFRGSQPWRHLDLGLPASGTVRKSISVVCPACGTSWWQPQQIPTPALPGLVYIRPPVSPDFSFLFIVFFWEAPDYYYYFLITVTLIATVFFLFLFFVNIF